MRSTRTRVCMLIPGYHPLLDRSGSQLSGLLERIDRYQFAPFVLTRRLPGTSAAQMAGTTPVIRRSAPLGPDTFFLPALAYLWKRRREYDVIHVHSIDSTALAGAVIKRLLPDKTLIQRIPSVDPGTCYDRLTRSRSGRRRLGFVLGKADTIIAPGPDALGALKAFGIPSSKIASIPDGVDAEKFAPPTEEEKRVLKRSFGIAENAFVAIVVARLIPQKNVAGVLEAWKRVSASHPDAVLIVAGGGPEGPRLSRQADAEFEGRSVIFTGAESEDEIQRLYRTADAYVSYSKSEKTSDAVLAAMSAGLPVVSPHGPKIDPLVRHANTGFLFDADQPTDGADYLMRLAEDPSLLRVISASVRDEIVSEYSFEQIAHRLEGLYSGIPDRRVQAPAVPSPAAEVVKAVPATDPTPVVPTADPSPVVANDPPARMPAKAPESFPAQAPLVAVVETPAVIPAESPASTPQTAPPPARAPAGMPAEAPEHEPAVSNAPGNHHRCPKKRRHKKKRNKSMA